MLNSEEEELQAELYAALDIFFEQDPDTFLPHLQALQNRVRDLAPSLSRDTLQLAHDVAYTLTRTATELINATERSQKCVNGVLNDIQENAELQIAFKMEYMEHEEALSEDEDEPDTNWEALRDWFLAHLAQPFPTPSQCRRLVKECHIDSEELGGWLERMRELTHWNDLFSSWARSDQHIMKELMKLVQKEIDLGIPEHRCRTSSIQRVEVERLRQVVHKVYKPGPSEWYAQLDTLFYSDGEDGFKEDEDDLMWPPSDDDDAQELTAVDPDYGLATFFDADERPITSPPITAPPITAPIRPSNPHSLTATFANVPKVLSPKSALKREGLEWLDKLERVEAETETAYAEMERIAIKLENSGDETLAIKLEAAEIRFLEAEEKEKALATAAVRRMQTLQAQVQRGKLAKAKLGPTILLGTTDEPTIKSEVVEEVLIPAVKVEVDPKVSLARADIEASVEITLGSVVKPEPFKRDLEAESDAEPGVIGKTNLDTKVEADEREIAVEVNSIPSLTLKEGAGAAEVQLDVQEMVAVENDSEVKEMPKAKGEPTSPLNQSNKSELDTIVFGTFQPLEPEEIEQLVTCVAPHSATIIQLDPTAIIVPPGLIDFSKSRAHAQASEEQQVVMRAEPVDLNDEYVPHFRIPGPTHRCFAD